MHGFQMLSEQSGCTHVGCLAPWPYSLWSNHLGAWYLLLHLEDMDGKVGDIRIKDIYEEGNYFEGSMTLCGTTAFEAQPSIAKRTLGY